MRFPALIIFILLIPAFIALGHDMYLFSSNELPNGGIPSWDLVKEKFKFSAFGFIWTNYNVESYKTAAGSVAPETWAFIDNFLTFKAFFACLSFAGIIAFIMFCFALFGIGPMADEAKRANRGKEKTPPRIGNKKSGKMQFNRK